MATPQPTSPPPGASGPGGRPTSYWDYIRVEELLALQNGIARSDAELSDDEVRFIVIHQIDELWFKLVLRELVAARDLFARDRVPEEALAGAAKSLERITICFELAAQHFRLMETMRTQDYLVFRDKLNPASGFQSAQMREIEILLGLDDQDRIPFGNEKSYTEALKSHDGSPSPAFARVARRLADGPTFKAAVDRWLYRTPIDGSVPGDADDDAVVANFLDGYHRGHEQLCARALEHSVAVQALAPEDTERLRARYRGQLQGARRHFDADDVPAERRSFVRRLRAAILFIDSNRSLPLLSWPGQIIDAVIACEQAMLVFRQRHARMVERVIGRRVGTGGSDGVAYLDQTALKYRVFTEMWAARTLLLPPDLTPPLRDPRYYGLVKA
jgi:tryptophan 2,3-dioxygenase